MISAVIEEIPDIIVVKLDPGGPIEINDLTESFSALARYYERHYRPEGTKEPVPKLYVTRIETGSVIAEIVPYATILGALVVTMDTSLIVSEFIRRLSTGIKAFSDPRPKEVLAADETPSRQDAADIQAFVRPLTGKSGARLSLKHARMEKRDGKKLTIVEYDFDETQLNRASVNIDHALSGDFGLINTHEIADKSSSVITEVMLFFEQASKKPGKESGRTVDKGVIPDVSDKSLPVYFRKSFQNLKEKMVKGEVNPLTNAFIVDVHVQRMNGDAKAYIVTEVHGVVPISEN